MDTVPVSKESTLSRVTTPAGEACTLEVDATVAEAWAVRDATGVAESVETGNTVKSDSMAVGVGWAATPQSSTSTSSFEEEYNGETVPEIVASLTVPSGQV